MSEHEEFTALVMKNFNAKNHLKKAQQWWVGKIVAEIAAHVAVLAGMFARWE